MRGDFFEYRKLSDRLWVKGIIARAVGAGSARIIVKAKQGEEIPAALRNVIHVHELSRRTAWSYHRFSTLTQARQQGQCVVLADPVDSLRLHAAHGGGVIVPLERAHCLVWLPVRIASPTVATASVATTPSGKRLWHSRLGHLGESRLDELVTTSVEGLDFSSSEKIGFYETCAMCKSRVRNISREPADHPFGAFEVLGLDFCGPMSAPSLGGRRYNFSAVDFRSRLMLHDALRAK
jgi:hypothetical protein